jgi:hypothetical protein
MYGQDGDEFLGSRTGLGYDLEADLVDQGRYYEIR